ncbi:Ig-like domain-containing protein [Paenibacillus xylanexedens]|uniref:Ig-like domain-containing protein n=1 Tax=Paenibacillus xylanexedens TaxID=528191 RepID=UPI003D031595
MKKILSVALSTAMAFSMFASVAFGDTAVTPQQQFDALKAKGIFNGYPDGTAGLDKEMTRAEFAKVITKLLGLKEITGTLSYTDKNYTAKNWAVPYIEAVTAAGIMEGKNVEKKIFDFNGKVTVAEMATILTRALDLEIPTETNNNAAAWAKGYVQAAINAGLIDANANFSGNASRELLVGAAYSIDEAQNIKVSSYEVSEEGKVVTFKISDGESVKVTLDKALEANKETEVKFTYKDKEFTEKVTYVVTTATKLQTVSADNLREVKVAFDGEVDETTATDESNYTIENDGGGADVEVKSASLSSDKKTVTLTVESATDAGFTNQKEYTLDVANVRAGSKVITASDVAFTPVDAALPVANTVEALGNKAVKITFSEPVKSSVNANNFKIDGSAVVGTTDVSGNTVILKLYSTQSTGEHTITVDGVADYSGLLSISKDFKYNVVEDTAAPTIASVVSASFETVTLKFSEPVDPSTISAGNVYWNQGSTKRTADSFEAVSDNTYKFTFVGDNKLIYSTSLYVSGVQDYSGNTIASSSSITVNPVIDQTRPEVVSAKLADDSSSELIVKFTKTLDKDTAVDADNYVIKDSDGNVVSEFKNVVLSDNGKQVNITLFEALDEGDTYTLAINNVSDSTTLKNVLLPYSTTIKVGDVTAPDVTGAYWTSNNRLVVSFDKAMATSGTYSALDKTKYLYEIGGVWKSLPSAANLTISSNGKSVIIVFPTSVVASDVTKVRVTNVQSAGGVTLANLVQDQAVSAEQALTLDGGASATATNKIKVDFNQTIQAASTSDFEVYAGTTKLSVVSVTVDDDEAILTLSDSSKLNANGTYGSATVPVTINVLANKNLVTPAGLKFTTAAPNQAVADKIAPSISSVTQKATLANNTVTTSVYFTENIDASNFATAAYDFDVTVDGTVLKPGTDFTIQAGTTANVVQIVIVDGTVDVSENLNKIVKVRVNPSAKFLKDATNGTVATGTTSYYSALIQN